LGNLKELDAFKNKSITASSRSSNPSVKKYFFEESVKNLATIIIHHKK